MRKPIIVGNWKMNKLNSEAKTFFETVESYLDGNEAATYGIGAPFTCVGTCVANKKHMLVAAENCHFKDNGAYTGEVSVPMLVELGVDACIIGHSERRQMFAETDETVNLKAKRLFEAGIMPIMCIGETEAQFDAGETMQVIHDQLHGGLAGLTAQQVSSMVIAYEPIWAIGTGKSANKEIAENCCKAVRDVVREMFGDQAAEDVRVQYGGSVKPENIKDYMAQPDIDGALIGGASLKEDSFKAIIDATK